MALIEIAPFALVDATLTIASNGYETSVSTVQFVPTVNTFGWKGLTPAAVFNFPGSATWVCNITGAQDYETTNSLANYLFDHAGETVSMEFAPISGGQAWSATVTLVPGNIGGDVDTVPTVQVALQVQGSPARVDA